MRKQTALVLLFGLLVVARGAPAKPSAEILDPFRFPEGATVFRMDDEGRTALRGPPGAKILPVSDGSELVLLSGVSPKSRSEARPGIFVTIPKLLEEALSGQLVTVTVVARRPAAERGQRSFAVSYSTREMGASGWQEFPLTDELKAYSFEYDVPQMKVGNADFIGILPDPEGRGGAVEVAAISVAPVLEPVVSTAFYDLAVKRLALPGGPSRRGALARVGPFLIYGGQKGRVYWVDPSELRVEALDLQIPLPYKNKLLAKFTSQNVSIFDLAAEPGVGKGRYDLYASYLGLDEENGCIFLQLSKAVLAVTDDAVRVESGWRQVFRSEPCLPLSRMPYAISMPNTTAGRIAFGAEGIVVTIGPFTVSAQNEDMDYGKIVRLDRETFAKQVISTGHRNAQGLYIDDEGTIFETEHGPHGGDEVNIVREGKNYGWPLVTYGTNYGKKTWCDWRSPSCKGATNLDLAKQGRHLGYEKPMYAFVPSIGISQIIQVTSDVQFPVWRGDFLIASLTDNTLYRLHLDGQRVVVREPAPLRARLRDMVELEDGRIAILTDARQILLLSDSARDEAEKPTQPKGTGVPREELVKLVAEAKRAGDTGRGKAIFDDLCAGCHATSMREVNVGPPVGCIFGASIAAVGDFSYSPRIRKFRSMNWTPDALHDLLEKPQAWAGAGMESVRVEKRSDRRDLIAYLASLRTPDCFAVAGP